MYLTRHNLLSKDMQCVIKTTSKVFKISGRTCLAYLTNLLEINQYKINIDISGNLLTIKYKAPKYTLTDLFNEPCSVFGNGKRVLQQAYIDKVIEYNFVDNYNTYQIKIDSNICTSKEYLVETPLDSVGSAIIVDICKIVCGDKWALSGIFPIVNELVGNIVHYTNIRPTQKRKIKIIVGMLKYGIQEKKKKSNLSTRHTLKTKGD